MCCESRILPTGEESSPKGRALLQPTASCPGGRTRASLHATHVHCGCCTQKEPMNIGSAWRTQLHDIHSNNGNNSNKQQKVSYNFTRLRNLSSQQKSSPTSAIPAEHGNRQCWRTRRRPGPAANGGSESRKFCRAAYEPPGPSPPITGAAPGDSANGRAQVKDPR